MGEYSAKANDLHHEISTSTSSHLSGYKQLQISDHHIFEAPLMNGCGQSSTASVYKLKPEAEKQARKKLNDKVYREKQKKGQEELKSNLERLTRENGFLNGENGSLKSAKEKMTCTLESQSKVIAKLKYDLEQLRSGYESQNLLIRVLSQNLENHPGLREENQRLEIENELLRQVAHVSADQKMYPSVQGRAKLEVENRRLKLQNTALCAKLVYHSRPRVRNVDGQKNEPSSFRFGP